MANDRQYIGSGFRVPGSEFGVSGFQSSGTETARVPAVGIRRYEDLIAWQLARELERRVVAFTAIPPVASDFDYCRQVRRSSSSAARNLAEGFGRYLPGDFARFTRIALGSLNETRDHLASGREKGFMTEQLLVELVRRRRRKPES